ncbi:MAG TPA: transglycosylase SLT domain-containing protein [Acidiferrobacterales bacterium]
MMPRLLRYFIPVVVAGALAAPALAAADLEQQRRDYLAAQAALRAGDLARFRQVRPKLDDYLLRGMLDYEFLKDRVAATPPKVLREFLAEHAELPASQALRTRWLEHLARTQDWENFFREYRDVPDDSPLNCTRLRYLLSVSTDREGLLTEVDRLWSTGNRLPDACEPVFSVWRKAGHMTNERLWERIGLAIEQRNLSLAGHLGTYLEERDRAWLQRWLAMHRNPAAGLRDIRYPVETPVARQIVRHGVVRLAFNDPEEAMRVWTTLQEKYEFFGEDESYVLRFVGLLAAQRHLPQAVEWLSAVPADANDANLRHWRVRAALRAGQWRTGLRFLSALTQEEQGQSEWRYWKARLLEQIGEAPAARALYNEVARERSYYGFLAADRLGMDYAMQHVSIEPTPAEVGTMLARPGIQVARELYTLGEIMDARRQWAWTTRAMNNRQLQVAAVLAREWGWHDRAILTVAKSDHLDDLELRFPILYRDIVEATAERNNIDPSWVYGVLRQESAFVTDARSPAGALGLMQLMPQTGRQAGRRIKLTVRSNSAILDIENNLRLGASYLRTVLDVNRGNQVLATAAYNAGPNRVRGWLPATDGLPADAWVESIPYTETRNYVKNVLGFTAVYDYRLGVGPTRLVDRMVDIAPSP